MNDFECDVLMQQQVELTNLALDYEDYNYSKGANMLIYCSEDGI